MQQPGFTEDGDGRCLCFEQDLELSIVLGSLVRASCGTKCGYFSMLELELFCLLEEGHISRVGAGPATFDVINSELV